MYRNSFFSKAIDIAINLKTSDLSLLMRGKVIIYVITSSFKYICRSQCLFSKLAETLLRGKGAMVPWGRRGYCV
jgi:hypothetical protein